jgi:2,3-bisphosphoglycerate-independent phosphoglycerate mutase
MIDAKTHEPITAHTTNPAPFIVIKKEGAAPNVQLPLKELSDIARFILEAMRLPVPPEMK